MWNFFWKRTFLRNWKEIHFHQFIVQRKLIYLFKYILHFLLFFRFSGSQKCLELLVHHYEDSVVHLTDSRQRTPLHIAALHGHVECAKYLIEHGAEVEVIDEEGRTPYVAAAQYGQTPIVGKFIGFVILSWLRLFLSVKFKF